MGFLFVPESVTPATHLMNSATVTNPLDYCGAALPSAVPLSKHFHAVVTLHQKMFSPARLEIYTLLHCIFHSIIQARFALQWLQVKFIFILYATVQKLYMLPTHRAQSPAWTLFSRSKTLCRCVLVTWSHSDIWWMIIIAVIDSKRLRGFLTAVLRSHVYKSPHKQSLP